MQTAAKPVPLPEPAPSIRPAILAKQMSAPAVQIPVIPVPSLSYTEKPKEPVRASSELDIPPPATPPPPIKVISTPTIAVKKAHSDDEDSDDDDMFTALAPAYPTGPIPKAHPD
jgi:hypothetical protein